MKTVSAAMAAHLAQGSTTLTTCWKIVRTDGQEFLYTELDDDVTFNNEVYKSAGGFNKSAIKSSATFAADELEVAGFLRDDGITDDEIRNGAFDHAKVEVFMINYMDTSMGIIKLRSGHFGEVRTASSGAFLVELRGLVDMLQQKVGDTYLPECSVDLGSPKCGIQVIAPERQGNSKYALGQRVTFPVASPRLIPDRHYKQFIDPNLTTAYQASFTRTANINMQPYQGPKVAAFNAANFSPGAEITRNIDVLVSSLDITPGDVSAGTYEITFRGRYFVYSGGASGAVAIQGQRISGSFYQNLPDQYARLELPNVRPDRRWREFSVTLHVTNPLLVMVRFQYTVYGIDNQVPEIDFDDLDIIVSAADKEQLSFQHYGGVEFECTTAGTTSQAPPTFPTTIDETVGDGSVVWKCVQPKWTFLGEVSTDATNTTTIAGTSISGVDAARFEWGVLKFLTGKNAGRAIEVMSFDPVTGIIVTALPLPYRSLAGDLYQLQAGCDKRFSTCKGVFGNQLNFRGFPRVPGQGQYFKVAGMQ